MFLNLLKKEFTLALHPTSVVFVFFAAFVFIPNYPYEVMCFFSCLSIYFMCLSGRENKDIFQICQNIPKLLKELFKWALMLT